ncbi:hypothetical protein LCGC14_0381840 [marine sediment metagenome]|uniref:Uncharacterized protein n=1 Tax=marine sediment metagenome TaxID=412755 RepID=A0A0F9TKE6_9ZZZZ
MHLWIPLLLATFVMIRQSSPSLNAAAKVKVWNWIVVVILSLFLILTILEIRGLWWTWLTLGVHFSTVMLVANATRSKLGNLNSLTLGVGVASFAAGLWEIAYTMGYFYKYDVPQDISSIHLYAQIIRISPLAIGGIGVAIAFWPPKLSWLSVSMLLLSAIIMSYWLLGAMWVDVVFDWQKGVWIQTEPFNWGQAILYRSSKATLALGLIGLYGAHYTRGRGIRLRLLVGYAIIPLWIGFFMATSAFLVFTWFKSLFASEGKLPYFKTRTIHYDRRFDSPGDGGRNE